MCEEIKLLKSNALKSYNKATKEGKELLSELLKGQVDFNQKITDRINSYEDACADQAIQPLTIDQFSFIPEQYRRRAFLNHKHSVVADSLNEGWIPNWKDHNQAKYFPYFKDSGAGFEFSYTVYACWRTPAAVSSRLYFKTRELAEKAGEIFVKIGIE
jgi:hypothetical protein